jgi:hypothetical protein
MVVRAKLGVICLPALSGWIRRMGVIHRVLSTRARSGQLHITHGNPGTDSPSWFEQRLLADYWIEV